VLEVGALVRMWYGGGDTDHGFVGGGDSCCRDGDGEAGTGTRYPASGVGGDK